MKTAACLLIAGMVSMGVPAARAEWYAVSKVEGYNTIQASLCAGAASKDVVKIRIRNLEKIEYIQNDRVQVFLGGAEPGEFLSEIMLGQIVWVEGLETVNGEYVANVYPSYEQVLKVFSKQRMAGLYTISPLIKQQIGTIYNRMLSDLKNSSPARDYVATPPKNDPKSKNGSAQPAPAPASGMSYENDYLKALLIYDGLSWFKTTGQFLDPSAQDLFVDWLGDYQSATGNDARTLEIKIKDMMLRSDLYRDFLGS